MRTSRMKRENFLRLVLSDRYDGRGHLHDLSEYDAEHNSWNRNYNLSEEEARIEALCDEERYLALHTDLLEEEARQEEEYKRLSEALAEDGMYNSVGFQYKSDYYDPSQPTEEEEPQKDKDDKDSSDVEDGEEPFIAPEGLNVPPDVELPPTAKMHAIIERTANFVCKQGAQFEIMLKAKQARNSQFDFLRFDHYLNPYYKHIQKAMKEGRYTSQTEKQNEEQKKSMTNKNSQHDDGGDDDDDDDDDDDEDSDYLHPSLFASKRCSRLEEITKPLKVIDPDHPLAALVRKAQNEKMASQVAANVAPAPTPETESVADNSVTSTYYNYYMLPDGTYCLAPPPPGVDTNICYNSLPAGDSAQVASTSQSSISPSLNNGEASRLPLELPAPSTLAPVVAIIPPPPDIQPVIDKLAQYVARNGLKFETSVRAKNDSRFEFLQPWHQYNPYYEFKKHFFMQKEGTFAPQPSTTSEANCVSAQSSNDNVIPSNTAASDGSNVGDKADGAGNKPANDGKLMKVSFAPISFAIKVKETDLLPLEKNRVKLDDDSEEEEDGEGKDGQQSKTSSCSNSSQLVHAGNTSVEEKRPQLTPEELEAKQAKQKLEDRLAAAAREKLAQAAKESKEKQLQAERKRKAALFLQTLKNPLEMEMGRMEESTFNSEDANSMNCDFLPEDVIVPTTEYPVTERSPIREFPHEEREKKKKKRKKRSRSRSRSPRLHYESKSRSHSKVKHSLPTAYRTVRRSRSRSRSPRKPPPSTERRRDDNRDRDVPCSYRVGHGPGNSRKRSRSRSPYGNGKKKHSRSESKSKVRSRSRSPSRQGPQSSIHSTSISPVESRGSSQERYRERAQDKDGHIASEIVSSVQSKITQDLMAKVRAMLAASKNMRTGAS
ncbi:splicing factor, suppressor of white-apricot homolog isoform 2-T2 [Leptodactylus fuscus]|uniref:splicing factor, suppressor of white-apricot homolog isoform X2 n=1 Tax=Leptodactylus fuscus TaxID=238119 RepID=UPI003F4EEA13